MARARNIKPGFFTNDDLAECDPLARILFAGLWCISDRAGRLEDRPKKIKAELLPYDAANADKLLSQLEAKGFILRYKVGERSYIQVLAFEKHQNPHVKEAESVIPAPHKHSARTVLAPLDSESPPERAGLIPDSGFLIPDSLLLIPDPLTQSKPLRAALAPVDLPAWLSKDDWQAYRDHRGAKFTPRAQGMAIKQLDTWRQQGQDPGAILRQSVMNGWKGMFELKTRSNPQEFVNGMGKHGQATAAAVQEWLKSSQPEEAT